MSGNRWPHVKELFHAALARSPEERAAFLAGACNGDTLLIAEVQRLLAAHAQVGDFMEQSPASLTGRRLGRYEVGALLGMGGMGEVYAARDTDLGRDVALKIASRADPDAQARLRREAQHASRLNHPNICTVHEVGTESGHPYVVMEYVQGRQLSEIIPAQGLELETLLRYGIQIADALSHAHQHGVIHRDLKGSNVVVTPEGRPKVLDFGLARRLPADDMQQASRAETLITSEGILAGTPAYMAPELLRGEPADARSDVWALGVLLYEMATGRRPFEGSTAPLVSASIVHDAIAPLPERVPASLQAIIRRTLAKDLRERYQQAVEVRSALETVREEVSAATAVSAQVAHPRGWTVQSRPVHIAALVGVVVIAIALAVALMRSREPAVAPIASASGRPAIAVMNFEISGAGRDDADAWLAKGVPSMLVTGLAQMPNLDIVSGQRLREVSAQEGLDNIDATDRGRAAAVARRAGAGAIVVGTIFKTGADVRIDAQLEDLSSGRVLAAETVRGTDLYALADQLAAKIRDGIGFDQQVALRKVADISSASLEAYKLYADGVDAYMNTRLSDAEDLLRRAVAIDPDFVQAYVHLAFVNQFTRRPAAAETYLRKAATHVDRLTERERLLVRAELGRVEGRFADAGRLTDELVERFPDYDNIYPLVSLLYTSLDSPLVDPNKAVFLLETGVKALPRSAALRSIYGYALMAAGRFDDARREFETSARFGPREPNPYDSLGELHLAIGEPAKGVEFYSRALTISPGWIALGRSWGFAALGRYDQALADASGFASSYAFLLSRVGRYRAASTELAAGLKEAEASGSVGDRIHLQLLSAVFSIELQRYRRAREDIAGAARTIAEVPEERRRIHIVATDMLGGIIDARTGSLRDARLHLDAMKRRSNPAVRMEVLWRTTLESEIALATNQPGQAVVAHGADERGRKNWFGVVNGPWIIAGGLPFRDGLARAKKAQGDLQGAIATYRELLTPTPQQEPIAILQPRYLLEIARLLEQTGDRAAARNEYMHFLDMWKRADAELPELDEARTALVRLR